jgi:hypothetical protein
MPDVYKVLGQSNPAAATLTDAYTVPASTEAIIAVSQLLIEVLHLQISESVLPLLARLIQMSSILLIL